MRPPGVLAEAGLSPHSPGQILISSKYEDPAKAGLPQPGTQSPRGPRRALPTLPRARRTLLRKPFKTWEALTERNRGMRIGFSRMTAGQAGQRLTEPALPAPVPAPASGHGLGARQGPSCPAGAPHTADLLSPHPAPGLRPTAASAHWPTEGAEGQPGPWTCIPRTVALTRAGQVGRSG